ncbi:hypothetical protein NXS19_000073 [Fusarium pseudograminearum]|nr:hypothetical protein NXS19_000073 [Fusarium pseudograminearum]
MQIPFKSASFNLNRSSTLPRQDISSPFASKATLLCVVFVYASILVIWALMFAAVTPDAYPLTALACLYTAVTHRRIYWKYLRKFFNAVWILLKFLCNFMIHYWDSSLVNYLLYISTLYPPTCFRRELFLDTDASLQ